MNKILGEYEKLGYSLPEKPTERLRRWEAELDEMVGSYMSRLEAGHGCRSMRSQQREEKLQMGGTSVSTNPDLRLENIHK